MEAAEVSHSVGMEVRVQVCMKLDNGSHTYTVISSLKLD